MRLIGLFVFTAGSVLACAQDGAFVSGRWKVHSSFSGYQSDSLCALVQNGSSVTGTCSSQGSEHPVRGTVEGAKVSWSYDTDRSGTKATLRFAGSFDPAAKSISGSVNVAQFKTDGSFTATPDSGDAQTAVAAGPSIRVAIVGLVHTHVAGLLGALPAHSHVELAGISEGDGELARKYAAQFHLRKELFFTDTEQMLSKVHPDAVLVYTDIADHRKVIEMAARHGISSMVEKPLATNLEDALAIRRVARERNVHVLVNYETTWYASNAAIYRDIRDGRLGDIRRAEFHDGHNGPKAINVPPEFLKWLVDPVRNGAGAAFDFGCYGADLMTLFMRGEAPISVTAVTLNEQPAEYPTVEDDATIVLRYPKAEAVLEPSWSWPFARKDTEVYGSKGYEIAVNADKLRTRFGSDAAETESSATPLTGSQGNSLGYLAGVLHKQVPDSGELSSLDTNMIVMQILSAARESAKTGRTVVLKPLPQ